MRQKAKDYGYLRSNQQIVVSGGPYITIAPAHPAFIVVPTYDPYIVYAPALPGFFVGGAIGFGFGITIGTWFRPWGWRGTRFGWDSHAIFINDHRWDRGWDNRRMYVHDYPGVHRYAGPAHVEHYELIRRSAAEREAPRGGHEIHEEHHHH